MGACISSGGVSEEEKARHREAEKALKEAKVRMEHQVKVHTRTEYLFRCQFPCLTELSLGPSFRFGGLWQVNHSQGAYGGQFSFCCSSLPLPSFCVNWRPRNICLSILCFVSHSNDEYISSKCVLSMMSTSRPKKWSSIGN